MNRAYRAFALHHTLASLLIARAPESRDPGEPGENSAQSAAPVRGLFPLLPFDFLVLLSSLLFLLIRFLSLLSPSLSRDSLTAPFINLHCSPEPTPQFTMPAAFSDIAKAANDVC